MSNDHMDISPSPQKWVLVDKNVIDKSLLAVVASYLDESDLFNFTDTVNINDEDKSFWHTLLLTVFPIVINRLINPPGNLRNYYKILSYYYSFNLYDRVIEDPNYTKTIGYVNYIMNHNLYLKQLYKEYPVEFEFLTANGIFYEADVNLIFSIINNPDVLYKLLGRLDQKLLDPIRKYGLEKYSKEGYLYHIVEIKNTTNKYKYYLRLLEDDLESSKREYPIDRDKIISIASKINLMKNFITSTEITENLPKKIADIIKHFNITSI